VGGKLDLIILISRVKIFSLPKINYKMTQIYLISPPKIELNSFSKRLENALKTGLVPVFQLRLKDYQTSEIIKIAAEIQKICRDNNCLFLLNDFWQIALDCGFQGVHLGEGDGLVSAVRKKADKNFVIGVSCYNSRHLAIEAAENDANYVAFGAFFPTTTKEAKTQASPEILSWAGEILNLPCVAIGGINASNAAQVKEADFIAVISAIWNDAEGEVAAIQKLQRAIL